MQMGTAKDDEEYWNSIDRPSFSFETNDVDTLFGVSKSGTAKLLAGVSSIQVPECYLKPDDSQYNLKPLLAVISEKTLNNIIAADKTKILPEGHAIIPIDVTLRKILLGQQYSLECYKSLSSKTALLDAAIASGDGNAILIAILFIAKTLKSSLLQRLLFNRFEAVHVYIHYLSTRLRTNELTDLLSMQGRSKDAAMKNLQIIIQNTPNPARLLQKLQTCYKMQFANLADCKESAFVQNYIKLLEWQTVLKNADYKELPELNSSALECLRYTCRYHWNSTEGSLTSPKMLWQQHGISSRQYQRIALITRASAQTWEDIDALLLTKGWLGNKKLQTTLPIEDILKILHEHNAPSAVLDKYLNYVDNIGKRLEIAKKFQCDKTVIDIYVLQGDRISLLEYKGKLHPQSELYFYAESALRVPSTKWRS
ncbi:spermatogenesis-defective protein 39 homolog [Orussus abietinus]|uniref:spermatogenesis-defective protein 39 homolog n=1 Tax=Orussus abietinus TaxID=222816 RepID=UPI0006258938|nr:spermatogenesis-defective protein 39 homolog [Orussus abietinus]